MAEPGIVRTKETEVARRTPPVGVAIEVFVRYQGREYVMTKGKVREVNLERHVEQAPWSAADAWQRWELTGIETLTIVVEREPPDALRPDDHREDLVMTDCICVTKSRFLWNHLRHCPWRKRQEVDDD